MPERGSPRRRQIARARDRISNTGRRHAVGYPAGMPRDSLISLAPPAEKAFLVAVDTGDDSGWRAEDSLAELGSLATTAGADVVGAEWQNRRHVDPNWYVGK